MRDILKDKKGEVEVPPPEEFQDLEAKLREEKKDESQAAKFDNRRRSRALEIQKSLEARINQRKSLHEIIVSEAVKEFDSINFDEELNGIMDLPPSRPPRKSAVSRTDSQSSVFVVEHTGDMLESKSLPRISKSNGCQRELSCDINKAIVQSEEKCLEKLVNMVDDNSLAFLRAKEAFKKSMDISGILYRFAAAVFH